jgi:hypothetical protein
MPESSRVDDALGRIYISDTSNNVQILDFHQVLIIDSRHSFILFLMNGIVSKANLKGNFFQGNSTIYTSFIDKINHFFFSVFNLFVLVMLSSFYQKV